VRHRSIASYGARANALTVNDKCQGPLDDGDDDSRSVRHRAVLFSAFPVQSFGLSNVSALQTFERFLFLLLAEAIDHDHGHLADRTGRIWNVGYSSGHFALLPSRIKFQGSET
jgi:hypothetical protein